MKAIKYISLILVTGLIALALSYEKIISGVLLPQYINWPQN